MVGREDLYSESEFEEYRCGGLRRWNRRVGDGGRLSRGNEVVRD